MTFPKKYLKVFKVERKVFAIASEIYKKNVSYQQSINLNWSALKVTTRKKCAHNTFEPPGH
jgi:hypothetical protein